MKCKCVKGIDGFTWGEIYDVEFAGRVWWAVNNNGEKYVGHLKHLNKYIKGLVFRNIRRHVQIKY